MYKRESLAQIGHGNVTFCSLISNWFPFKEDEDESRVSTDLLVQLTLENTCPHLTEDITVRQEASDSGFCYFFCKFGLRDSNLRTGEGVTSHIRWEKKES